MPAPIIFVSYAHRDDPKGHWIGKLKVHLSGLEIQDEAVVWGDLEIQVGEDWHQIIQSNLENAKIAVLLVGPAFVGSKYIRQSELPVLLKNARDKGVEILPVLLRPSIFDKVKFKYPDSVTGPSEFLLSSLQTANPPGKELNGLTQNEQDLVLKELTSRIQKILLSHAPPTIPEPSNPPPAPAPTHIPPTIPEPPNAPPAPAPSEKPVKIIMGVVLAVAILVLIVGTVIHWLPPKPVTEPWKDEFYITSERGLFGHRWRDSDLWDYPEKQWELVKGIGKGSDDGAILIKGDGLGVYRDLGSKAFYNTEVAFKVKFQKGARAAWILRAQSDKQRGYIFELEMSGSTLFINGYDCPAPNHLLPQCRINSQPVPIKECCKDNDYFRINVTAKGCEFTHSITLENSDLDDARKDLGKPYGLDTFKIEKCFTYGNVGLLGIDKEGQIKIEFWRVTPIKE